MNLVYKHALNNFKKEKDLKNEKFVNIPKGIKKYLEINDKVECITVENNTLYRVFKNNDNYPSCTFDKKGNIIESQEKDPVNGKLKILKYDNNDKCISETIQYNTGKIKEYNYINNTLEEKYNNNVFKSKITNSDENLILEEIIINPDSERRFKSSNGRNRNISFTSFWIFN